MSFFLLYVFVCDFKWPTEIRLQEWRITSKSAPAPHLATSSSSTTTIFTTTTPSTSAISSSIIRMKRKGETFITSVTTIITTLVSTRTRRQIFNLSVYRKHQTNKTYSIACHTKVNTDPQSCFGLGSKPHLPWLQQLIKKGRRQNHLLHQQMQWFPQQQQPSKKTTSLP